GLDEMADHGPDDDRIAVARAVGCNPQDARVHAFDIFGRLVALQAKERLTGAHQGAVGLKPAVKDPLLHVPAEPRHGDWDRHGWTYSARRSRMAPMTASTVGTTSASRVGLYGVGVCRPLSRRIGASRSSKPRSAS